MVEEDEHREFLLNALRAATLRARCLAADCETIGVALKGNMISADTAVAWIRDANLMWLVGAIPEEIGRIAKANPPTPETPDGSTDAAK